MSWILLLLCAAPLPPRAVEVVLGPVHAKQDIDAAFSRDGRLLAVASDAVVEIWSVREGIRRSRLTTATNITALRFGPDGLLAVGCNDGTVVLHSLLSKTPTIPKQRSEVTDFAFPNQGESIVVLSRYLNTYSRNDGTERRSFRPRGYMRCLDWNESLGLFAMGGVETSSRLVEPTSGKILRYLPSPLLEGENIVWVGFNRKGTKVWTLNTSGELYSNPIEGGEVAKVLVEWGKETPGILAVSAMGGWVAHRAATGEVILQWPETERKPLHIQAAKTITGLAASHDGAHLALFMEDGQVRIRKVRAR